MFAFFEFFDPCRLFYDLFLPIVVFGVELVGAVAVFPAEGADYRFVIHVQRDPITVRELLREDRFVVPLHLSLVPLRVDYAVEADAVEPEEPFDVFLGPKGRGIDPYLIAEALQLAYELRRSGAQPSLPGDVDCSGAVNATDALTALRYAMGMITLDEQGLLNGAVNATDALMILRMAMGIVRGTGNDLAHRKTVGVKDVMKTPEQ